MVQYNTGLTKSYAITAYGADPTGVSDSTAAIAAAKTAAGAGSRNIILIPPGTYLTNPFTLDGFHWQGYGPTASILKANAGSSNWVTNVTNATGERETMVQGLGFDGTNLTGTATVFTWANTLKTVNGPTIIMRDCWVYNGPALGIDTSNASGALNACTFDNVVTHDNGSHGWQIGSDQKLLGCLSENNGLAGFFGNGASSFIMTDCKAYTNGTVSHGSGYGYDLKGTSSGAILAGCMAQDNQSSGLLIDSANAPDGGYIITGLVCDTNGRRGSNDPAVNVFNSLANRIDFVAVDRTGGSPFTAQTYALAINSGSTGNMIDCAAFFAWSGGTLLGWLTSGSTGMGNTLRLGNSDGLQAPAFASTITPDVTAGGIVNPGALTGAVTIGAPVNPFVGARLTFEFLQDGTGGRAVSWNAIFKFQAAWTNTGNTLNKQSTASFVYDGTNWVSLSSAANVWF